MTSNDIKQIHKENINQINLVLSFRIPGLSTFMGPPTNPMWLL